jgi:hypothetical protein
MNKPTDEELIELAKQEEIDQEYYDNSFDIGYYQESHRIVDGKHKVYNGILYHHYRKWSASPVSLELFHSMLKLNRKTFTAVFIDKQTCNIDLNKVVGDYVKAKKVREKEKRVRQISSLKPQT